MMELAAVAGAFLFIGFLGGCMVCLGINYSRQCKERDE